MKITSSYPGAVKVGPDARLLIAGSLCRAIADGPGLEKLGIIPDMASAYRNAWVAVNPVYIGSGQSVKTVEALGYCVPLVTTTTGARGLERFSGCAFIEVANR